jgi:biopolymer transport protein ExbD
MKFKQQSQEGVDINLTPLIDVVFLLLIFFMVTTTFNQESELKINLPQATEKPKPQQEEKSLELIVDASGQYYINGRAVVNTQAQTLVAALGKAMTGSQNLPLTIRADARTPHQAVVTAMDSAAKLGLTRIFIATTKEASESEGTLARSE